MTNFATTRLALRPAAAADGDDMYALEQDPEVMRFLSGGVPVASRVPDPTAGFLMPRGGEPESGSPGCGPAAASWLVFAAAAR